MGWAGLAHGQKERGWRRGPGFWLLELGLELLRNLEASPVFLLWRARK